MQKATDSRRLLTALPACCTQIYAIYDYQVKYAVRLATENPYVPTFGADIPGGPPGLGVSATACSSNETSPVCRWADLQAQRRNVHTLAPVQLHMALFDQQRVSPALHQLNRWTTPMPTRPRRPW